MTMKVDFGGTLWVPGEDIEAVKRAKNEIHFLCRGLDMNSSRYSLKSLAHLTYKTEAAVRQVLRTRTPLY